MKAIKTVTVPVLLIALIGGGCSGMSSTQKSAAVGAATGAAIGGVVGHQSGEAKAGAAIGAAAGGLAGAAIGHQRDHAAANVPTTADTRVYVQQPPPTPASQPQETIPPRPAREAVWVQGYYDYTGNQSTPYNWVPGHWEIPPPGMTTWIPGSWQRSDQGYTYVRGHWQ